MTTAQQAGPSDRNSLGPAPSNAEAVDSAIVHPSEEWVVKSEPVLRVLLFSTVIPLSLIGCSTDQGEGNSAADPALIATFEEFLESAENDFEREVFERALENGEISEEDYEEANSRYLECMEGIGLEETATKKPNGLYERQPVDLPDGDQEFEDRMAQSDECAFGTVAAIEAAYNMQVNNPEGKDPAEVTVGCLQDMGAVEADYTPEEFEEAMDDFDALLDGNGPFDLTDTEVVACLEQGGYHVSLGE